MGSPARPADRKRFDYVMRPDLRSVGASLEPHHATDKGGEMKVAHGKGRKENLAGKA
jgi:hypothetical protein